MRQGGRHEFTEQAHKNSVLSGIECATVHNRIYTKLFRFPKLSSQNKPKKTNDIS